MRRRLHTMIKYLQKTYLINEDYPKYTKKNINNENQAICLKNGPTPKTLRQCTKEETQMENKHKKIWCTSYVIRERWIETILRHHIYLLEWTESGRLTTPNSGEDMEQEELSCLVGGNVKWYRHLGNLPVADKTKYAYKIKYTLYVSTSNHAPSYNPKELIFYVCVKPAHKYV